MWRQWERKIENSFSILFFFFSLIFRIQAYQLLDPMHTPFAEISFLLTFPIEFCIYFVVDGATRSSGRKCIFSFKNSLNGKLWHLYLVLTYPIRFEKYFSQENLLTVLRDSSESEPQTITAPTIIKQPFYTFSFFNFYFFSHL